MNSVLLSKKQMNIHGSWKAGYKVSDSLVKSIALEITSTPSKSGTLWLSSSSLTVEILPTRDGKRRTANKIPFDSLRDISINPYQRNCLLIVYLDASNKFSVMACSSRIEQDINDFSKAFKDYNNFRLRNAHSETPFISSQLQHVPRNTPNWILQRNPINPTNEESKCFQEPIERPRISSGVTSRSVSFSSDIEGFDRNQHGSFQRSLASVSSRIASESFNDYEDVFFEGRTTVVHQREEVVREHAGWTLQGRQEKLSVGIQFQAYNQTFKTKRSLRPEPLLLYDGFQYQENPVKRLSTSPVPDSTVLAPSQPQRTVSYEDNFDTESMTSISSQQSTIVTSNEGTNTHEKSKEISSEVFHKASDWQTPSLIDSYSAEKLREQGHKANHANGNLQRDDSTTSDLDLTGLRISENNNNTDIAIGKEEIELRSCGTQINTTGTRRYTKNLLTRSTLNSYREKAETVKQPSSVSMPKSPVSTPPDRLAKKAGTQRLNSVSSVKSGSLKFSTFGRASGLSLAPRRGLSLISTTVIKPIEKVYAGRSTLRAHGARVRRPIIIYAPTPNNIY